MGYLGGELLTKETSLELMMFTEAVIEDHIIGLTRDYSSWDITTNTPPLSYS